MKKILKLLVMLLLLQIVLVSCDEDEDSPLRYDYFRDHAGFSNSLYNEYVYDRSPYSSVKKATYKYTSDGWNYTTISNYDDSLYTGGSYSDSDGDKYNSNREWDGNSFITYNDDPSTDPVSNSGTIDKKGLLTSIDYTNSSSYTYKYDGWDLVEYSSKDEYDDSYAYTAKYTFDGDLPETKTSLQTSDGTVYYSEYYETKTEYKNDGDRVTSSAVYSRSSSSSEFELREETTYEYEDGNVTKVITENSYDSYEIILLTWKDNLPVEQKMYRGCDSADDCTDENLDSVIKYEWSKKRLVKTTRTSYTHSDEYDPDTGDYIDTITENTTVTERAYE
ncbi:MAG: hypothetical protein JXK07_15300 [Spirochaetes bacterium]|nr:hypothetical protein [Spirochaetota bacterium]MBN2769368.1 hypothetical protein [Spirochaetota bacterium]